MTKLDSLWSEKAVEMYLTSREDEVTRKSLQNINPDLKIFKKWCDAREVADMEAVISHRMDVSKEILDKQLQQTIQRRTDGNAKEAS
ncbi:hypothetical protein ACM16X_00145 [Haloarcula japonica]|uniref:hypothetical protein n=1 Tax=Haloarcula japonica TaxID=29282 RepID=UPI0039F662D1